ncbi:TetR/AcrR family transcriptional regulator [Streptacidiphilus neutrinimicus]|uniref:TetR/AcrR family transcriptional regulator n=1 Tax=Streptacidiphilus neutrinimicus TaxID=105420 RepID=UPI0009FC7E2A|nr:TetR/AcrR family transcriptional regulator [Streptacidiphilus neutrinimicus]
MPRIRAASVAEHRRLQHDALLDAARELLAQGGMEALTFPGLAARTGLARSSVYEYFKSRAAVVEALCAVDLPAWAAEVAAAVRTVETPVARVEAYVRAQLALVGDARHRALATLSALELDEGARERIRAAHGLLVGPLVDALTDLGHPRPALAAQLLQGTVEAAAKRLALCEAADEKPEAVVDAAVALVLDGVSGSSRA